MTKSTSSSVNCSSNVSERAIVAVGHSILVIAYHLLAEGTEYADLGGNYFDERDRRAVERDLVRRLEKLGHKVTLTPFAPGPDREAA